MKTVEVHLPLPTVLHLTGEALGKSLPFHVEGLEGALLTPGLERRSGTSADCRGRHDLVAPEGTVLPMDWSALDCDWGHVSQERAGEVTQASVYALFFRGSFTQLDESDRAVIEVGIRLKVGIELFLDWLQVLSGQDLCSDQKSVYRSNSNGVPYIYDVSTGAPVEMRRQAIACVVTTNRSATAEQLTIAGARASACEEVPVAHTLLVEGERALRRGHLRRAASELGSALEVALSSAVRRELSRINAAHAESFVRNHTLGAIVSAAVNLGIIQESDRVHERVVSLRNKAIHEALAPNYKNACTARDLVRQILLAVHPVPGASAARMER